MGEWGGRVPTESDRRPRGSESDGGGDECELTPCLSPGFQVNEKNWKEVLKKGSKEQRSELTSKYSKLLVGGEVKSDEGKKKRIDISK
jgi:hypothetical protein